MSESPPNPTQQQACACHSYDRYECWRSRYRLTADDSVDDDGGPCQCACHSEYEEHERDEREALEDRRYGG